MPLTIACPDAADTFRLGAILGAACRCGLVIALRGELGCGKTTFVQGLAAGLEVPAGYRITSPSYTLINEYPGRIDLAHADLYRLSDGTSIEDIGLEDLISPERVLAVEWPERMPPETLSDSLRIDIRIQDSGGRVITLNAYGLEPGNLLEAISEIDT
jgi:tRNA threonylcarbamoyladenosine biosynthesis protein TsaE